MLQAYKPSEYILMHCFLQGTFDLLTVDKEIMTSEKIISVIIYYLHTTGGHVKLNSTLAARNMCNNVLYFIHIPQELESNRAVTRLILTKMCI